MGLKAVVTGIEWDLIPRPAKVQCDECGDQYEAGTKFMRREERARLAEQLRGAGWRVDGDHERHVCPDCKPDARWFSGPLTELRSRLETLHEQIKGRGRDYRNGRTKDRYHERARGVRLAIDELNKMFGENSE